MEEEENEKKDWRDILNKLNQQIKQVDELPKEPKKTEEERERKEIHSKDFVDIKLEYRRIKIQEQCKKLSSRVVLPSRSSWRDRIAAAGTSSSSTNQPQSVSSTCNPTSPECQRRTNLNWGQRRTKVYHIDSEIDVHKFKIMTTKIFRNSIVYLSEIENIIGITISSNKDLKFFKIRVQNKKDLSFFKVGARYIMIHYLY